MKKVAEVLLAEIFELEHIKNRLLQQAAVIEDAAALAEFQAFFHTEDICVDYLYAQKWPNGFHCPRCSHTKAIPLLTRRLPLYKCVNCLYQASPIVDTIIEDSRTDLRKWFTAMHLVSASSSGINARKLSLIIKVTYKTAWLILRKIRQAITQADDLIKLVGNVNIDKAKCGKPCTDGYFFKPEEFPVIIGTETDVHGEAVYVKIQMVPE